MRTGSAAFRALKGVRDRLGDALAAAAARWEPAEHAVAAVGRALHGRSALFDLLLRRTHDTLSERRAGSGPVFRRMRVGPVEVWGEVGNQAFATTYYRRRPYEAETAEVLARWLRPGHTFVDVGANHGYFTVLAAALVGPAGRVVAFEPNPVVAAALREVLARNGLAERVAVRPAALCDRDGTAPFFPSVSVNDGLSSLVPSREALDLGVLRADRSIQVPVESFDGFAERAGLGRVELVKIDVEGAEGLVVRGMERTLAERPPRRIICETVPGSEAARLLTARGYAMRALERHPTPFGNYLFTAADA
jgi:FkbM family methyltransferase